MFDALQVELDDLVYGSTMEKPQHLGKGKRCCNRSDEWCTNPFPGKKCNPAAVEVAVFQHVLISRAVRNIFTVSLIDPY